MEAVLRRATVTTATTILHAGLATSILCEGADYVIRHGAFDRVASNIEGPEAVVHQKGVSGENALIKQ